MILKLSGIQYIKWWLFMKKQKLFENNNSWYNWPDFQIVTKIHTNGILNCGIDRQMDRKLYRYRDWYIVKHSYIHKQG